MKLNLNLAVCGQGAVTPAGIGVAPLVASEPWKETPMSPVGNPGRTYPTFRVNLQSAALKRWQMEPRLRRASPLAIFMAEAASQALADAGDVPRERIGIVAAFFTGSLVYSQRFFQGIINEGQKFASPSLFPETVFNSPLSHLASILKIPGACYAIVGDESAWVTAIMTAATWLRTGVADRVLVVGAEELAPIALDAYESARWLRPGGGFIPSEGAGALLLREAEDGDRLVIPSAFDGHTYRTRREAAEARAAVMREVPSSFKIAETDRFPDCGEAFAASAAWHTIRALSLLHTGSPRLFMPVCGRTQQISALEFSLCGR